MMFRQSVIIPNPVWYCVFVCIYVLQLHVLEIMAGRELVMVLISFDVVFHVFRTGVASPLFMCCDLGFGIRVCHFY